MGARSILLTFEYSLITKTVEKMNMSNYGYDAVHIYMCVCARGYVYAFLLLFLYLSTQ